MPLIYSLLELMSWYSTNMFFRDITVVNQGNMPKAGPTIVYGNHNNQFVDGMLLMRTIHRPIHFIAAAKSCRRPILGKLIQGSGAIPVERPQDLAKKGEGVIVEVRNGIIRGKGTKFTALSKGAIIDCKILPELAVSEVISDEEIKTNTETREFAGEVVYKIIPKLDFSQMFEEVWTSLKNNECIGIYPEGGSHDRLQLLPLKAGICMMALGAMEKHGITVTLVPCGFSYYNPQKFRSKAILEFGPPYEIPLQMIELYKVDKRKAVSILLNNVEKMLKAVTIQFKSYNELNALYLCRTLYTMSSSREVTTKEMLELNRRFARGYNMVKEDPKYTELHQQVLKFAEYVKLSGLPIQKETFFGSRFIDFFKFVIYFERCLLRAVIALPGLVMFWPTTSLIAYLAEKERIKCLQGSKVKMQGTDVVGSYKIMLGSYMLPLTCAVHSGILFFLLKKYTKFAQPKIIKICLALFALQPIYALLLVRSYDSFKTSFKKLRYLFANFFRSGVYDDFNKKKREIQKKVITMVEKVGGEVVQNFDENRVLKKEDIIAHSGSQLYIFDEDRQTEEEILKA